MSFDLAKALDSSLVWADSFLSQLTPTAAIATGGPIGHGSLAADAAPAKLDKASAEDVKKADEARLALDEKMKGMAGLGDEQRRLIKERVAGVSGDALVTEMNALQAALAGPNADRALATYGELGKMVAGDEKAAKRLTPEVIAMLVNGVAERRTESERGQAGVLGKHQAHEAARALLEMGDGDYEATIALLAKAGTGKDGKAAEGAGGSVEQSLILKAVASRGDKLKEEGWGYKLTGWLGNDSEADVAQREIGKFAADIRGMNRGDLVNTTTLLDIDDRNTRTRDPDRPGSTDDQISDNDGLAQFYGHSCVPTTAQIVRGEVDPIFALKAHRDGLDNADSDLVKQQKEMLEANGGRAVGRDPESLARQAAARASLKTTLAGSSLSAEERARVGSFVVQGDSLEPEDQAKAVAVIAKLRAENHGSPTDEELKVMRGGAGMEEAPAMKAIAQPGTHASYSERNCVLGDGIKHHIDDVQRALENGQPVPLSVGSPGSGHEMLMTDMRTDAGGNRKYLVTDPWTGATRWVSDADFQSGKFAGDKGTFPEVGATWLKSVSVDRNADGA